GSGRGTLAWARSQGDRVQEAPAQELAPQARAPPGIHPGSDHRDPHRRQEAVEDGARQGQKAQGGEGEAENRGEGRSRRGRSAEMTKSGDDFVTEIGYDLREGRF